MMSSRARVASACPLVAFITAPTSTPAAAVFPDRILATTSGFAAIAASTAESSSPSSLTTARERAATTWSGSPSPASMPSSACLASLSLSAPVATSSATLAT